MTSFTTSIEAGWSCAYSGLIPEERAFESSCVTSGEAVSVIVNRVSRLPEMSGVLGSRNTLEELVSIVTESVRVGGTRVGDISWAYIDTISELLLETIRGIFQEAPLDVLGRVFSRPYWTFEIVRDVVRRGTQFAVIVQVPRAVSAALSAPAWSFDSWSGAPVADTEGGSTSAAPEAPPDVAMWERRPLKRKAVEDPPFAGVEKPVRRFGKFKK